MIDLRMRVTPAGRFLAGIMEVLDAPMAGPRGIAVTAALRASVAKEFAEGAHSLPEGGTRPWAENVEFGTRVLPETPLGGPSGSLAQAWAGASSGGFLALEERQDDRVLIGVSHPSAAMHRGGDDASEGETVMDLTFKAASFLRHEYGVEVKGGDVVHIPARPHATTNPALEEAIVAVFQRSFAAAL